MRSAQSIVMPTRRFTEVLIAVALAVARNGGAGVTPRHCSDVTLCLDVPATFPAASGTIQLQAFDSGRYRQDLGCYERAFSGASAGLSSKVHIDAIYLMTSQGIAGTPSFLFSVDVPLTTSWTDSGATVTFQPTDVVRYLPASNRYDDTPFLAGSAIGVTPVMGANVDAVAMDKDGALLLSFDVPVTLGGTRYKPADVIRVNLSTHALSHAFQASAAFCGGIPCPLPDDANVNGVEMLDNGDFYFTVGVPLTGSHGAFGPGHIIYYSASAGTSATWTSAWEENQSFDGGAGLGDFSFRVSPGHVPNGANVPGTPLRVTKGAGGTLDITWSHSTTRALDAQPMDYSVYEGTIGAFTSCQANVCTTGLAAAKNVTPLDAGGNQNVFFIVVPHNNDFEGSYGFAFAGGSYTPRGQAASPCARPYGANAPMLQFTRSDP